MYAEFTAAFQSAKTLFDLVKATQGLSNSTEVLTAVNDAHMKLSEAIASALASQERQAALIRRVQDLETQLREVEDWQSLIQRYKLVTLSVGTFAHQLKQEMANGEPLHYLCTACVNKKKKTILQPNPPWLHCPECKTDIQSEKLPPLPVLHM